MRMVISMCIMSVIEKSKRDRHAVAIFTESEEAMSVNYDEILFDGRNEPLSEDAYYFVYGAIIRKYIEEGLDWDDAVISAQIWCGSYDEYLESFREE